MRHFKSFPLVLYFALGFFMFSVIKSFGKDNFISGEIEDKVIPLFDEHRINEHTPQHRHKLSKYEEKPILPPSSSSSSSTSSSKTSTKSTTTIPMKKKQDLKSRTGHNETTEKSSENGDFSKKLQDLIDGKLTKASEVVSPTKDAINIGMIIVNRKNSSHFLEKGEEFRKRSIEQMKSLFVEANSITPLHFIVLTDARSRKQVGMLMQNIISDVLVDELLKIHNRKRKYLPPVYFSLVDFHEVYELNPDFCNGFKQADKDPKEGGKYSHDFFNIAPLYANAFTKMDKLIFVDCFDLVFQSDIKELQAQFRRMGTAIIGMGKDLTPHYRYGLEENYWKIFPNTIIGKPGRFQGLNSGVVLYDLKKMRQNKIYQSALNAKSVTRLQSTYGIVTNVGDQDWFTMMSWRHPGLFYILPCEFNTQVSLQYMEHKSQEFFDDYHFCNHMDNIKIVHLNGCGPMPENCGHMGDPDYHSTPKYREGYYFFMKFDFDWMFIAGYKNNKKRKIIHIQGMSVVVDDDDEKQEALKTEYDIEKEDPEVDIA